MQHNEITQTITDICSFDSTDFQARTVSLFEKLDAVSDEELIRHIECGGVIPESFSHDSSQEKLFAKYCDYLLARGLTSIGIPSTVIEERADAADVLGKHANYDIVGDAKAFRLSRTAKNQKDFKVESLNQWKKGAPYACLVCPLFQYPTRTSQIYGQAIRYNVTLFSFTHLGFLLKANTINHEQLEKLWSLSGSLTSDKDAVSYWNAISKQAVAVAGVSIDEWDTYLDESKRLLLEQAQEQLGFWELEKQRIRDMSHDEAVDNLIRAFRIDSNIELISKTVAELESFVDKLD